MTVSKTRITCLVDNAVAFGSPCWGEHGLAMLIEVDTHRILFDTAASGAVLEHNLNGLEVDTQDIEAIVLSHGHADHTGGLDLALKRCPQASVYAHPDLFVSRFSRRTGKNVDIGCPLTRSQVEQRAELHLFRAPAQVAPGVWTTGQVSRTLTPGTLREHLVIQQEGQFKTDTFSDDLSLVIQGEKGLILVLGCCHSGLRNTLYHVQETFSAPICAILGGSHLSGEAPQELEQIVTTLRDKYSDAQLYLNHCTGISVVAKLQTDLPDRIRYYPAGTHLTL